VIQNRRIDHGAVSYPTLVLAHYETTGIDGPMIKPGPVDAGGERQLPGTKIYHRLQARAETRLYSLVRYDSLLWPKLMPLLPPRRQGR
jgi:hypothetical protein